MLKTCRLYVVLICFLLSIIHSLCELYPSTYPLSHEIYTFDTISIPRTTPNYQMDESDPGGYYVNGFYTDPFINQYANGPYFPPFYTIREPVYGFFFDDYFCFQKYGVLCSALPDTFWNCSQYGYFFEYSNFPGKFYDKTICTECCKSLGYYGELAFGVNFVELSDTFGVLMISGGCGYPNEELYCNLLNVWSYDCIERYTSPASRVGPLYVCYDAVVLWLLSCFMYKVIGFKFYVGEFEPPLYLDSLSTLNSYYIFGLQWGNPDRACLPYSYWHPGTFVVGSHFSSKLSLSAMLSLVCNLLL